MAVAVSSIRQAKLTLHVIQAVNRLLAPGSWLLAPGSWLLALGSWLLALAHALHRGRSEIVGLEILEAAGHRFAKGVGLRATGGGGQVGEALLNGGVEADGGSRARSLYSLYLRVGTAPVIANGGSL